MQQIHQVYFSPASTTKTMVQNVSEAFQKPQKMIDLLRDPQPGERDFSTQDLLVVGMPVYAGRIPALCAQALQSFRGNRTPVIALVAFGNRDYDDALLELTRLLEDKGFYVVGAAAFVTQHSIFSQVGEGRPDGIDRKMMEAFGVRCKELLAGWDGLLHPLEVKGNTPYREAASVPLKPSINKQCTACGACAEICPTKSIDKVNPKETNPKTCISCTACMHVCPTGARGFHGMVYKLAGLKFQKEHGLYKKPELFYNE